MWRKTENGVCHVPFVWAGPSRADLKIVTGRAGSDRDFCKIDGPGHAKLKI